MRVRLAEAQNWRCCYCGVDMSPCRGRSHGIMVEDEVTIEHVARLADGGVDAWENLAAACYWCNNRRGEVKDAVFWAEWIDLLKKNGKHPHFPKPKGDGWGHEPSSQDSR